MISEAESFLHLDEVHAPVRSPGPFWNLIAIFLPANCWFGFFYFMVDWSTLSNFSAASLGIFGLIAVIVVGLTSASIGLICAIIALARNERLVALTVLGLFLNLLPLPFALMGAITFYLTLF